MRAQIESKLASYGLTPSGREFVIKALDPACVGMSPGIPDTSACSVLRPEYTVQYTIATPSVATPTWDLMVVLPPGDVNSVIFAYGPGGTDFNAAGVPAGGGVGWVPLQQSNDVSGTSLWTALPSGAPNSTVQRAVRLPSSGALSFRHTFKSVTAELVAPAVADQGDVFAAQYPFDSYGKSILGLPVPSTTMSVPLIAESRSVKIPFNESDLTLSARNPFVGRARDGVYMPLKLIGPEQSFCALSDSTAGYDNESNAPIVRQVAIGVSIPQTVSFDSKDNGSGTPTGFINTIWSSPSAQHDTGYDNTSVGVIFWRGLAAGGGGSFGASVMLKVIAGHEICPKPSAFDRVYLKAPVRYEPLALQAYYALMSDMAPAYPARYNALGALLPLLASFASRLMPSVYAGGRTFLRELVGEEKAAEKPKPPSRRSPSVKSVASLKPSLKTGKSKRRSRVRLP